MEEQPISHPIRDALLCGLLLALVLLCCEVIVATRTITATIEVLPSTVDAAVARESAVLRKDFKEAALSATDRLGQRTERQVIAIRKELLELTDRQADSLQQKIGIISRRADTELAATGGATRALLDRYRQVPDDAAYATRHIWDCEGNPDCLENRYVSVSRAVEQASRTVQQTTPRMAAALERSAAATASTTEQTNLLVQDARTWLRPLPKWAQSPWVQIPAFFAGKFGLTAIAATR